MRSTTGFVLKPRAVDALLARLILVVISLKVAICSVYVSWTISSAGWFTRNGYGLNMVPRCT